MCEMDEQSDIQKAERECELVGTDHAEVGALILEWWKFPDFFCEAVHHHHTPSVAGKLAHLVHIADKSAHAVGLSDVNQSHPSELSVESLSALTLTDKVVQEATQETLTIFQQRYKRESS